MIVETPSGDGRMNEAADALALAERAKLVVAEIYDTLGALFADKPRMQLLATTLASEEREHAERMAAKDPKLADFFGQLSEDDRAHVAVLTETRRGFRFDGRE